MWTRRALLLGAGGAVLARTLPGLAAEPARAFGGPAFGTAWRVVLAAGIDPQAVRRAVEAVIAEIDLALSPYVAASEISRFNRAATADWIPLSALCGAVVEAGLDIAAFTEGAFDPTVGGLVHRYGFGPIDGGLDVRYTDLAARPGALLKRRPDATFDPCGIAKGYALDLIADRLIGLGVEDFLIELGGEVSGRGFRPADGQPWQVGIERPGADGLAFQRIVRLQGEALATSGNTVQVYAMTGQRYGHIIDPQRHRPADDRLASVSVLSGDGMTADALATALFAMGGEAGPAFAEGHRLSALFVLRDGTGIREIMTGGFAARVTA